MAGDPHALLDAVLRWRIHLAAVEHARVRELIGPLDLALEDAIERLLLAAESGQRATLLRLVAEIAGDVTSAYRQLGQALPEALLELAAVEATFQAELLRRGFGIAVAEMAVAQRATLLAASWGQSLSRQVADTSNALRVSTRLALAAGEGAAGIAGRFGAAAGLARSGAEGLVREGIAETTQGIALHIYDEEDLGSMWVATLDSDTCLECADLDTTLISEIGEEPPAHRWCRCTIVPVERGIPRTMRERESEFGPVHVRNYATWFNGQSAAFQRDVLGSSRYALFKKGKLPLASFVDAGRTLNLEELGQRHAAIFEDLEL